MRKNRNNKKLMQVELANLIPGKGDAPIFPLVGYGGSAKRESQYEKATFELFLDKNFPRKKYAALRDELDKAARSKGTTPIILYASIVETRQLLRSYVRFGNFMAEAVGDHPPSLQICESCGLLFFAQRRDARFCSPDCGSRDRVARARKKAKLYEQNRKLKGTQR